ncbi:MAG: hypothetical protein KJ072_09970 [Verrucomicrobia bacterium]|nr:hypothetical protein [Verrucomicrobiota bacterium]
MSILGASHWRDGGADYRVRLYVEGVKAGESGKAVFDRAEILKVLR